MKIMNQQLLKLKNMLDTWVWTCKMTKICFILQKKDSRLRCQDPGNLANLPAAKSTIITFSQRSFKKITPVTITTESTTFKRRVFWQKRRRRV